MRQVFYLFFLDKINAVSEAAVYFVIMQLIMSVRRVFMILFCQSINWCGIFVLHAFLDIANEKVNAAAFFIYFGTHISVGRPLFIFSQLFYQ